jgi:hypothetical protein
MVKGIQLGVQVCTLAIKEDQVYDPIKENTHTVKANGECIKRHDGRVTCDAGMNQLIENTINILFFKGRSRW